jgi:hypothetical protein
VDGLEVKQFRKVQWLLKDVDIPVEELYNKQFSQQTIYKLNKSEIKREFFVKTRLTNQTTNIVPLNYDELYRQFLNYVSEELRKHSTTIPYYIDGKKSRVRILGVEQERIITIGESAGADKPIYKERLKKIYDKYPSPNDIKNVGAEIRQLDTAMGWATNYFAVFKALKEFEASQRRLSPVKWEPVLQNNNYVLIIDEINRGNISQIFGELITLIEPDKRKGAEEALELMLPYSKEAFSVPSNLYIIGTMNTADRSVEALDTALRRRFTFEPMLPQPELLQGLIAELDLPLLLQTINSRLEVLLTKDHTIGHAWLMNVFSLEDLQGAFKNKILPLLQKYFYNNYAATFC